MGRNSSMIVVICKLEACSTLDAPLPSCLPQSFASFDASLVQPRPSIEWEKDLSVVEWG